MSKSQSPPIQVRAGLEFTSLSFFNVQTLVIESAALQDNPLGDSPIRYNPVLVPRGDVPADGWPVVFVLSGFTGNGPNSFNVKTFEANTPQVIDRCRARGEAPDAVYVFCDAMTSWGGSQFINSAGMGRYEDFIAIDLVGAVRENFRVSPRPEQWCVAGGSSGGYGALHLASAHPEIFGLAAAIAPDSFFEASLLGEIWTALPVIEKMGGVRGVHAELESGRLTRRKDSHVVLNAIAMGLCYASDGRGDVDFPVNLRTGVLISEVWQKWKRHDPVVFLADRASNVMKIKSIYLDAGTRDQFHLQFGTRQIADVLKRLGARFTHQEFDGTHFDIGERRPEMWKWLRSSFGVAIFLTVVSW